MKPVITATTPVWKINVLVFAFLILVAQAHFFYQNQQVKRAFRENVREHATLLGEVIRLNAKGAVSAEKGVQDILETFLLNVSHFIDYLDAIKQFGPEELRALAQEMGLAGIRITAPNGEFREGPPGWMNSGLEAKTLPRDTIVPAGNRFYHRYSRFQEGDIITGLESDRFQELREKMGLPELFKTVTGIAGVRYLRLEDGPQKTGQVNILSTAEGRVAETRLALGNRIMVIGMGCELYDDWLSQSRREMILFSSLIIGAGMACSLLLHAVQGAHLSRVREFDNALGREKKDAALGRATATITHEIRNPLNAISMGLQRLDLEVDDLEEEHKILIKDLLNSVKRTDRIIADLKRFTGPLNLNLSPVVFPDILDSTLNLYAARIREQNIDLTLVNEGSDEASAPLPLADGDQCTMMVENLVKNAVEAQPDGGFLDINLMEESKDGRQWLHLSMANGGYAGPPHAPEQLLEPYVTTKTRGSGLGLAIVERIVTAHGGRISLQVPEGHTLKIDIHLPLAPKPPMKN